MSTLPGSPVTPARYGEAMVLYSSKERVAAVVDGAPPVNGTRLFVIEPGKATKVPYEAGRFLLDHYQYTGLVRVEVVETDTGSKYDIEQAKKDSEALLQEEDHKRFMLFVNNSVDDYIKRNKPVPPPSQPILDIITRRGYDLKKFGITPIGWEEPQKDARMSQMESEINKLKELLEAATAPKKEREHART